MNRKLGGNLEVLVQLNNKKKISRECSFSVILLQEITKMVYRFNFYILYIDVLNMQGVLYLLL